MPGCTRLGAPCLCGCSLLWWMCAALTSGSVLMLPGCVPSSQVSSASSLSSSKGLLVRWVDLLELTHTHRPLRAERRELLSLWLPPTLLESTFIFSSPQGTKLLRIFQETTHSHLSVRARKLAKRLDLGPGACRNSCKIVCGARTTQPTKPQGVTRLIQTFMVCHFAAEQQLPAAPDHPLGLHHPLHTHHAPAHPMLPRAAGAAPSDAAPSDAAAPQARDAALRHPAQPPPPLLLQPAPA